MSDNIRTSLYGADYDVRLVSASVLSRAWPGSSESTARVAISSCGRLGARRHWSPVICWAVAATGAYCYSMSSRYNLIGRPAVVAVRDGKARLILRRETVDDLLSLEVVVNGEKPIGVAVLGLGNVGTRSGRIIEEPPDLAARTARRWCCAASAVRRVANDRAAGRRC